VIRYITIDFWDTLFRSTSEDNDRRRNVRIDLFIDYCATLGYVIRRDQADQAFNAAWDYFEHRWLTEYRTPDAIELITFLAQKLSVTAELRNIKEIAHAIARVTADIPPPLCEESIRTVIPSIAQRFTLGIISDTSYAGGNILRELLRANNIAQYFTTCAFSDEVGRSKPHSNMFRTIIGDLENAHELIHIGDLGKTDVAGAKAIGAYAIRYDRFADEPHATVREDAVMNSWVELPKLIDYIENNSSAVPNSHQ